MKERSQSKKSFKKNLWFGVKLLLVAIQLMVSLLLIISLIRMEIVEKWIIVVISLILAVLLVLNIIILLVFRRSKIWAQILCSIVAIVCVVGGIFALKYTDAFNGFLNKITVKEPETKLYDVLAINDEIKDLGQLNHKSVGFLKTDPEVGKAEQLLEKLATIKIDHYDDVGTMLEVLRNGLTDAIVLDNSWSDVMSDDSENENYSIEDLHVVYSFKITIDGDEVEISDKDITLEPFIIYLSGSDSRNGLKSVGRSDVNIVVVVNQKQGKVLLVSIPRDTYVQLHGTTGLKDKLTHAGVYGIEKSKTTIEDFLGINIDHTIKVSFDTVVRVVDALGGIDINSDMDLTLSASGERCHFVEGKQHVDGNCALRFARERKSYTLGDRHRGYNQQEVIRAIIEKFSGSKNYLLKVPEILNIAADSFETSLGRDDIIEFVRSQIINPVNWEVESISVDGRGTMEPTYSMGANLPLYVMIPYEDSVVNAVNKINEYLKVEVEEVVDEVVEETQAE
ncbi:LCP family protein [Candidatus Saccharibacteria bacterium]|nr:LCP family protein [Candidatus Saccharibacteria bacterium]